MALASARAGGGLAHLPAFLVRPLVNAGTLEPVLTSYAAEVGGVHVVYPHSRLLAPKVSEFVALARDQAWEAGKPRPAAEDP